jgi:hypothetical protein
VITKFEVIPVSGATVALNAVDGSGNHLYPLKVCDINTNIDVHEFKRMAQSGQWPSFHYPDAMSVHVEGNILGFGVTPSNDYITKRLALIDAVLPPIGTLTSRKHGVLRVRLDGMTEDADTDIVVTAIQVPMASLFPANSEFMITWKAFNPYFTGVGSLTKYQFG